MSKSAVVTTTSLLVIISLTSPTASTTGSCVLVRPTDSDPSACHGHIPCDTLDNLISNNKSIFNESSYSLFQFQEGTHKVTESRGELVVSAAATPRTLTWNGSRTGGVNISCEGRFVFVFLNISKLTLEDLTYLNCGHTLPSYLLPSSKYTSLIRAASAVALVSVTSVKVQNVVISQSHGYGLLVLDLRGSIRISSSHFLGNNASTDRVGGNAAFYFYGDKLRTTKKIVDRVNVNIVNSTFQDGADWSGLDGVNCSELQEKTATNSIFNANGLAIVAGQTGYRVSVQVNNANFSGNTGNGLHPSVWVHDFSGVKNNSFEFRRCNFVGDGALRISNLENSKCNWIICYRNLPLRFEQLIVYVLISHCTFLDSSQTGLEICVKPQYVKYNNFQLIQVKDCSFENTQANRVSSSAVRIDYITHHIYSYPSVSITIQQSRFVSSRVPGLLCYLEPDTYVEKDDQFIYPRILELTDNQFSNTMVQITTPSKRLRPIWRYEDSINDFGKSISRVNITNCAFTKTTSVKEGGTLMIENVYIILNNSTFRHNNRTALYALESVIHMEGVNTFDRNNGEFGGALNLNRSRIYLTKDSLTVITNNCAQYGGGIFALADLTHKLTEEKNITYNKCTVSEEGSKDNLRLSENKATILGHSLFGGTYTNCRLVCVESNCTRSSSRLIQMLADQSGNDLDFFSPPSRLYICEGGDSCERKELSLTAFPGQTITVPITAVRELNRQTNVVVTGKTCEDKECRYPSNDIEYCQRLQQLNRLCTDVNYAVKRYGLSRIWIEVEIDLKETVSNMLRSVFNSSIPQEGKKDRILIHVEFKGCPVGFASSSKNNDSSSCTCLKYLEENNIKCNKDNGTVIRLENQWIYTGTGKVEHNPIPNLLTKQLFMKDVHLTIATSRKWQSTSVSQINNVSSVDVGYFVELVRKASV